MLEESWLAGDRKRLAHLAALWRRHGLRIVGVFSPTSSGIRYALRVGERVPIYVHLAGVDLPDMAARWLLDQEGMDPQGLPTGVSRLPSSWAAVVTEALRHPDRATPKAMAARLRRSRRQVDAVLTQYGLGTAASLLAQARIERARSLLQRSPISAKNLAQSCGWAEPRGLVRAFHATVLEQGRSQRR